MDTLMNLNNFPPSDKIELWWTPDAEWWHWQTELTAELKLIVYIWSFDHCVAAVRIIESLSIALFRGNNAKSRENEFN